MIIWALTKTANIIKCVPTFRASYRITRWTVFRARGAFFSIPSWALGFTRVAFTKNNIAYTHASAVILESKIVSTISAWLHRSITGQAITIVTVAANLVFVDKHGRWGAANGATLLVASHGTVGTHASTKRCIESKIGTEAFFAESSTGAFFAAFRASFTYSALHVVTIITSAATINTRVANFLLLRLVSMVKRGQILVALIEIISRLWQATAQVLLALSQVLIGEKVVLKSQRRMGSSGLHKILDVQIWVNKNAHPSALFSSCSVGFTLLGLELKEALHNNFRGTRWQRCFLNFFWLHWCLHSFHF